MTRAVVLALAASALVGCVDDGEVTGDDPSQMSCALLVEGDQHDVSTPVEVELIKGVQGYMLVRAQAHLWGETPRSVDVRVSAARSGEAPFVTVVGPRPLIQASDGRWQVGPLEVWLSPPEPEAFAGKLGTLRLELRSGARSCRHALPVRFVDHTYCVHYEDGHVRCP